MKYLSRKFVILDLTFELLSHFSQKLARVLVENRQGNGFDKLKCSTRINSRERDIAEIVIHTMIVLSLKKDNLLLQPLALMMVSPNDMQVRQFCELI